MRPHSDWIHSKNNPSSSQKAAAVLKDRYPELSRSEIEAIFTGKWIIRNGRGIKKGQLVFPGDRLKLLISPPSGEIPANSRLPLNVISQAQDWVALDKPMGTPVHPVLSWETDTLANAVVAKFPNLKGIQPWREAGACHRLDHLTGGIVLFAKNQVALETFREKFKKNEMIKIYLMILRGSFKTTAPVKVENRLKSFGPGGKKMCLTSQGGRPARSWFYPVRSSAGTTLTACIIETGIRHQIRVHSNLLGHPIVNDPLYDERQTETKSGRESAFFLYHYRLQWRDSDGEMIRLNAPLPDMVSDPGDPGQIDCKIENLLECVYENSSLAEI